MKKSIKIILVLFTIFIGIVKTNSSFAQEPIVIINEPSPGGNEGGIPRQPSIVFLSPYLSEVRINWGEGSYGRTATYAINGTWLNYDYNKKMIHHFQTENK